MLLQKYFHTIVYIRAHKYYNEENFGHEKKKEFEFEFGP
jgi:hypothetical protein